MLMSFCIDMGHACFKGWQECRLWRSWARLAQHVLTCTAHLIDDSRNHCSGTVLCHSCS
jgi:hypothetical protein